jgi:putative NADH-flavin reductase
MRIAVVGANGRTGRIVVRDAWARGHQVVAVTRTDGVSEPGDENLTNAGADVRDADALTLAIVGADAVSTSRLTALTESASARCQRRAPSPAGTSPRPLLDSLTREDLYRHAAYVANWRK